MALGFGFSQAKVLKMGYEHVAGVFDKAMHAQSDNISKAATFAVHGAGGEVKTKGRANIGAAGFSRKWQNAFRVNNYPKRGFARNPAVFAYHRIMYAGVFEKGATIQGRPLLWIPLPGIPKKAGRSRMTPSRFVEKFGPLIQVKSKAGNPILMARMSGKPGGKVTAGKLRKGGSVSVPVFVGLTSVTIRKRFNLQSVFDAAAQGIRQRYVDKLAG